MTIFSLDDDLQVYAPELASLSEDKITGLISFVQGIVESDRGANRSLEVSRYREMLRVNLGFQDFRLTYVSDLTPLLEDPAPVFRVRLSGVLDSFRRPVPTGDWQVLTPDQYRVDFDGKVHLALAFSRFWGYGTIGAGTPSSVISEADVEYYCGVDFEVDPPTIEVKKLKAAFGRVMSYIANSGAFQGVERVEVPFDELIISYNSGAFGIIPDAYLLPFKKYRSVTV